MEYIEFFLPNKTAGSTVASLAQTIIRYFKGEQRKKNFIS